MPRLDLSCAISDIPRCVFSIAAAIENTRTKYATNIDDLYHTMHTVAALLYCACAYSGVSAWIEGVGPACHEDKMNQRARTLVLFLVICTCASLFYIGILLYLNSGCRGNKNINVYRINAAEDDYRADLDIVGKNANCLYNIDPASTEQSTVDDREQQFHPNNKISFHKRHPTRSRTRINATMKAHGTDQAPRIVELIISI